MCIRDRAGAGAEAGVRAGVGADLSEVGAAKEEPGIEKRGISLALQLKF